MGSPASAATARLARNRIQTTDQLRRVIANPCRMDDPTLILILPPDDSLFPARPRLAPARGIGRRRSTEETGGKEQILEPENPTDVPLGCGAVVRLGQPAVIGEVRTRAPIFAEGPLPRTPPWRVSRIRTSPSDTCRPSSLAIVSPLSKRITTSTGAVLRPDGARRRWIDRLCSCFSQRPWQHPVRGK